MRILFLTQIVPFPPDAGPRVKSWNTLRFLSQNGHEVHLVSFVRADENNHVESLRGVCKSIFTVPIRRSKPTDIFAWLRSYVTGRPFIVERDQRRAMGQLVKEIVEEMKIEIIHADQLTMAPFAINALNRNRAAPRLVFDAHNAVWKVIERFKENQPRLFRRLLGLEAQRVKRFEGEVVCRSHRTLAVSELDRVLLTEAATSYASAGSLSDGDHSIDGRISIVPIGVDTQQLRSASTHSGANRILALGTLKYPPNADGIRWFANSVFPAILQSVPTASLAIVGKDPPRDIRDLSDHDRSIVVAGYVQDLDPYFEKATVMIIPVRAGGGMRVRILEGFARGMPMVTTTIGLEGIEATPGREILVADDPSEFASTVVTLLRDELLRKNLAENGRRLVERKYDWRRALTPLDEIYPREAPRTRATA